MSCGPQKQLPFRVPNDHNLARLVDRRFRLMQGLLFGVQPHDAVTLAVVSAVMALLGILARWIPALRAARIDPAVAVR